MAMVQRQSQITLAELYHEDETAWLEEMSRLVAQRRYQDLDIEHLSEFLSDMARRDKREVLSRLTLLLAHLLKWDHQPDQRSQGWKATIAVQRRELADLLESGALRNFADEVLPKAYERAVKQACLETDVPETTFPTECPFTLDTALGNE
jgi:hypothetical protein